MKNKNNHLNENYLERIPMRSEYLDWSEEADGIVSLHIENTGIFNRIAQKLFKKPRITHIHLDELGSFVWPLIDGEKTILDIGTPVKEHFGDKAEPLYPRLAQFFRILDSYHFIQWKDIANNNQ